jgi:hypothetical protein
MAFLGAGQIRATTAAARTESMTEGTVGAKLEFAEFGGLGIVREWILILTQEVRDGEARKKHGEDCEPETAERDPLKLSAESLNFVRFVQDRHTG